MMKSTRWKDIRIIPVHIKQEAVSNIIQLLVFMREREIKTYIILRKQGVQKEESEKVPAKATCLYHKT